MTAVFIEYTLLTCLNFFLTKIRLSWVWVVKDKMNVLDFLWLFLPFVDLRILDEIE